jgi:cytochrome c oxidase assembly protein subunit 15
VPPRLRITGAAIVALTFVQLYFGALVAGLRAGLIYNTWPGIDGAFIPDGSALWFDTPWWRNLFENTLTVQFEHRMTAYLLLALAILHAFDVLHARAGRAAVAGAFWLAAAVALQATLGILTLLNQVPILLALSHQAVAILVLTLAVMQAERLAAGKAAPMTRDLAAPLAQAG